MDRQQTRGGAAQSSRAATLSAGNHRAAGVVRNLARCTWRVARAGCGSSKRASIAGKRVLQARGVAAPDKLRAALRAWLMRAAHDRLAPRVAALAAATGVSYGQVSIRRQRSRWGSCSARGTISLNCCLLFQRPEVVDYLIVHELMHVKHMNHSARFWQAVERHCARLAGARSRARAGLASRAALGFLRRKLGTRWATTRSI